MKHFLLIGTLLIILTGCGGEKVHENISEGIATDAKQILEIYDIAVKEKRSFTDDEQYILDDFQLLYGAKEKNGDLSEEESRLFILVRNMIDLDEALVLKESEHEDYEAQKKLINSVIKTGEIYN
ncbi:hypothetical protein ACQCT3_18055 [Sutcliffiella horikoshii]|uniref:hypothetical protein n=1 Tax=Sutcliffiella horikoshii TaxID=79883 RepID=UPI003CE923D6